MNRKSLRFFEAESLTNPWIQYAGWPAFWFGLLICTLQAIISSKVCIYYPGFMNVVSIDCMKLKSWVPAIQLLISVMAVAGLFSLSTLLLKKKMLNPFYYLSAGLLVHTIYFFHFIVNVLYEQFFRPWITLGPESGQLIADSIWSSINFIFVAWFYALFWTCLREVAGLKGSRLGMAFVLSVGVAEGIVALTYWYLQIGPIK